MALNAVEPWMCGLGGSGFMVIWLAREKRARGVNFQSRLPQAIASADYPLDSAEPPSLMLYPGGRRSANERGSGPLTTPGAVDSHCQYLKRFGSVRAARGVAQGGEHRKR